MPSRRANRSERERLQRIAVAVLVALVWSAFAWLAVRIGSPSWSRRIPFPIFLLAVPIALFARYLRGGWDVPRVDAERRNRFEQALYRSWCFVMLGGAAAYVGYLGVNFLGSVLVSKRALLWFGGIPGVVVISLAPLLPRLLALCDVARGVWRSGAAATLVERRDDALVAVLVSGERRTLTRSPHHDALLDELVLPAPVKLVGGEAPRKGTAPYRHADAPWTDVRIEPAAVRARRTIDALAAALELLILWVPAAGWLAAWRA